MKRIEILCLIVLLWTSLTSCAKIERLHITINDQLSSTLQLVMIESREDYDKSVKADLTPDLELLRKQSTECNFVTENYYSKNNYYGFKATKKFDTNSDLELSLSCMRVGQQVTFNPIRVIKRMYENEYEFQMSINSLFLNNEEPSRFTVTLPGELEDNNSNYLKGQLENKHLKIVNKREGKDTIAWEISRLNLVENELNNNEELKSPLSFQIRSKKSNFDLPSLIALLTLILGGGGIFSLISFLNLKKKPK
jgi:hypothetical protein